MSKGLLGCAVVGVVLLAIAGVAALWVGGQYNELVRLDETVDTAWAQVENAYQRRADLIPNLVSTVQGAADFERETLTDVIDARARATQVQIDANDLDNPQLLAQYQQAQDQLSGALSRLLVTIERYPELRANQNFLQLQDELAGTENRIGVERRRYNEAAQQYNTSRRQVPMILVANLLGFADKAYFQATEGADQAPEVDFNFRDDQR